MTDDMLVTGRLLRDLIARWAKQSPYTSAGLTLDLTRTDALNAVLDAIKRSISTFLAENGVHDVGLSVGFDDNKAMFSVGTGQLVSRDYLVVTAHKDGMTMDIRIGGGESCVKLDMDGDAR